MAVCNFSELPDYWIFLFLFLLAFHTPVSVTTLYICSSVNLNMEKDISKRFWNISMEFFSNNCILILWSSNAIYFAIASMCLCAFLSFLECGIVMVLKPHIKLISWAPSPCKLVLQGWVLPWVRIIKLSIIEFGENKYLAFLIRSASSDCLGILYSGLPEAQNVEPNSMGLEL